MNITDILILLGLLVYIVLGFRDGFVKKLFGIFGFWGGLIVATKFMSPLADLIVDTFDFSEEASLIIAFAVLFLIISLGVNLSFRWFGKQSSESLNIFSRIAGAILGAAQGLVAISLILVMFSVFEVPAQQSKDESLLYAQSYQAAPTVFDYSTMWVPTSKAFFEEIGERISVLQTEE